MGRKFKMMFLIYRYKTLVLLSCLFFSFSFSSFSHDDHGKMIEAIEPYPEIRVDLINLYSPDFKLEFTLKNFNLIPFGQESNSDVNEGHILLLVNNKKKIMIDTDTFILKRSLLKKGKNEVFVMLMNSDHDVYTKEKSIIYVSKRINNR